MKPDNARTQKYEIILKSNTYNSENEPSIFVYRDSKVMFLQHYEFEKYKNVVFIG